MFSLLPSTYHDLTSHMRTAHRYSHRLFLTAETAGCPLHLVRYHINGLEHFKCYTGYSGIKKSLSKLSVFDLITAGYTEHKLTGKVCLSVSGMKLDYGTVSGMLCGAMANPMALNYASSSDYGDRPAISYTSVYPLAMAVRVIIAQLLLVIFL